ncbi:type II secretion system F family protein [Nakamurella silvestris]|nr:type II secretion system F family protein [Nakamurella silvestris]
MNRVLVGVLLGFLAGGGLLVSVLAVPPLRRVRLADRIAPYLGESARPSRLLGEHSGPGTALARLTGPVLRDLVRRMDRVVGGRTSVQRRLSGLDGTETVEDFRVEQVIWGALGLIGGLLLGGVAVIAGRSNPVLIAALGVLGGVAGVLGRDYWLSRQAKRHDAEMLAEFPVVAEMLALAVTAGEGLAGAMERVCRLADGTLARQLTSILSDTRSGTPLIEALTRARDRTRLDPLVRFLDGMAVASERGTPLAGVLRAQAADVRALGKRQLLESGGRKEVAMMIPVVFLVLPTTILFAMFPGLIAITTVAG